MKKLLLTLTLLTAASAQALTDVDRKLFDAINEQSWPELYAALRKGADINTINPSTGESPLLSALHHDDVPMIRFLIEIGADCSNSFDSKFIDLINKGLWPTIHASIRKGANINAMDPITGKTPLIKAIVSGNEPMVGFLLEIGADCNACAPDLEVPIPTEFSDEVARFLLAHEAYCNAYTADKFDCNAPTPDREVPGPTEISDNEPFTDYPFSSPISLYKPSKEHISLMLTPVICFTNPITYSGTPLMIASAFGNEKIVTLLLNHGAEINKKIGGTALTYAINFGDPSIVKILLTKGADTTIKAYDMTPLFIAKILGYPAIIKLLEEHTSKK